MSLALFLNGITRQKTMTIMIMTEALDQASFIEVKQLTSPATSVSAASLLHAQVREELPDEKKHALLPRPEAFFQNLLSGKTGALFGAFDGSELVGMVAVLPASSWQAACQAKLVGYPDADGAVAQECGEGAVGVIQSLCVLKKAKGQGVALDLIKAALAFAQEKEIHTLFAQVASDNTCSCVQFIKASFAVAATWPAPYEKHLLRCSLA
jgi:ribosomal protein S18 acetylase RimI-like enzyme